MKSSLLCSRFVKRMMLLLMLLACGLSSYAQLYDHGILEIDGVKYHLYKGGRYLEAYVEEFTGTNTEIVIPKTVKNGYTTYPVCGLHCDRTNWEVTEPLSSSTVETIRFESRVNFFPDSSKPTFNCPNLKYIYFEGTSPMFQDSYDRYFASPAKNTITLYLSDRTAEEIAEMTKNAAVWCDFKNIYPIPDATVKRNVNLSVSNAKVEIGTSTFVRDGSMQVDMHSDFTLKVYQGYDVYHVESVMLNGMEILGGMTFTEGAADYLSYYTYTLPDITSDVYISVIGENTKYEVSVVCTSGGTLDSPNSVAHPIYPNEKTAIRWFKANGNSSLTITPKEGYALDNVYRNSEKVTADVTANTNGTYTYPLTGDGFISVVFKGASDIIQFADANVKDICVANWDTNGDGELSKAEAAKVTTLIDGTTNKSVFYNKKTAITSFDEFQYFTGLTKVEEQAFYVDSIKSIVLPPTITSIEKEAFYGCRIQTIDVPEGVTSIGQSAFNSCANLENIVLPKSLTSIGSYAFAYTSIRQIFIPKNVNSITPGVGANIFSGCSKLVSIDVDKDNGSYDSRNNCSAIIEKTASGGTLVYGCKNSIVPDGVNKIGIQAFKSAGIKKMVIPSSVTSISIFVFADNMLDTLVMKRETPIAFDKWMFIASSAETTPASISNCVLVVPAGTKDAYATAGWKSIAEDGCFKEVVEEVKPAYFDVNGDGFINVSDVTKLVDKILHP